eukprot:TRINITY_DN14767_c0_g1_i1.p3 TRINITY_DN14767_c0_g1~~TRINITY_DN14767_c0_g1_i1.p3  ORF type:complete len:214 (-),score=54.55 TRINITY_DN14767_c0_g1_i1:1106-1747(-)
MSDGESKNKVVTSQVTDQLLLLKLIQPKQLEKFLHSVLDIVAGREDASNPDNFLSLARDEEAEWEDLQPLVKGYTQLFRRAFYLDASMDQLLSELQSEANLPAKGAAMIAQTYQGRLREVRAALSEDGSKIARSHLADFDWKVHLSMSSDKISSLQEPVLLLNLSLSENDASGDKSEGGVKKRDVLLELSKDELDSLIESLESANEVVGKLKS